jgi:pimeloyl-ACP methyl ester carboxylesterase
MLNESTEEQTITPTRIDKDGRVMASTRLTLDTDQRAVNILQAPTVVIPVIFVPGIMGTNLKNDRGQSVWRPPNLDGLGPVLNAIGQMGSYTFKNAADRQIALNPQTTQVDYSGSVDAEGVIDKKLAVARGWGSLARSSYQPMMCRLQNELNRIMELGKVQPPWDSDALRSPADYGEQKGEGPLKEEQLKHAANYRFDVWAGGYNWTKSNRESSKELIDFIEKTVLASYARSEEKADKVILVTHSMGGLVARAICNVHNYEKVLGVVHGVMPATGAPATYHHARCGYDGVAQIILGRNSREVIAVMGNSLGALELIPSADYNCGKPWLKLGGQSDAEPQLPKADPYEEIYKNPAWYGLVPKDSEQLLDPARLNSDLTGAADSLDKKKVPFDLYYDKIDEVKKFHIEIAGKYPKPAYVSYGADTGQPSWEVVHWQGDALFDYDKLALVKDNYNGTVSVGSSTDPIELKFGEAKQAGDGTVPQISGAAPGDAGVTAIFRQGNLGTGANVSENNKGKTKGYDHQNSYNDGRAQWSTLYSVIKVAQDANWHI